MIGCRRDLTNVIVVLLSYAMLLPPAQEFHETRSSKVYSYRVIVVSSAIYTLEDYFTSMLKSDFGGLNREHD